MRSKLTNASVEVIIFLLLGIFAIVGVSTIPFHPDEASWLYMSKDFESYIKNPLSLMWDESQVGEVDQYKRMIDPPLAKYVIGLGRSIVGIPPIRSDWNWELSWADKKYAGALPNQYQLSISRLTNTWIFIPSTVLIYIAGKILESRLAGVVAALFFGTNSLLLLHNRHIMAEIVLTLCIIISIIAVFYGSEYPWFTGLAVAVALNSKQSALPFVGIGLISILWIPTQNLNIKRVLINLAMYSITIVGMSYILNPLWWSDPIRIPIASWFARVNFKDNQIATLQAFAPNQVLDTPIKRLVSFIANLYILPVAFFEAANYINETEISQIRHLSFPGHNILRGFVGGKITLLLSPFGVIIGSIRSIHTSDLFHRRRFTLLLLATFIQAIAILIAIPIPYQRYVLPMIPFIALWIGYGASLIIAATKEIIIPPIKSNRILE